MADLIPRFSEQGYSADAVAARRKWVEERTGEPLTQIGTFCFPAEDMRGNVENPIGAAQFDIGEAGDLFASVTLPSLTVGTVGGGTSLGTARECLGMLGCAGTGKAARLAEIAAAYLLGGEISLMAAISAGELVGAHEAYGRNRPGEG